MTSTPEPPPTPPGGRSVPPPVQPPPVGQTGTPPAAPPPTTAPPGSTGHRRTPIKHTRTGRVWLALASGALVLIIVLIFILQNTQRVVISFLGWDFEWPLGVALLFAVIAGLLLMALAGGARIWQLRRAATPDR
ncbi:LapA family protein [Nocardia inohanensis]|uniref:LapA family protein n=1 Tax=Nocardia inohanensis TaxID=209246 RepID=UPI00082E4604|nr:lipopolysaccharide assembly protein LapA domain-containing protein [Nocardia inohanensis]